jgi:urease accessory protein
MARPTPFDLAVLAHDERHLRRKVLELVHGEKVLVDLPEPVMLHRHGDLLVLDDGRHAEIVAAEEELYEIRARDRLHLANCAGISATAIWLPRSRRTVS